MNLKNFTRRPFFWILFTFIAITSIIFSVKYFSSAYSVINIDIKMDRQAAQFAAKKLAKKYNLGPKDAHQALSFDCDSEAKTYIELECGGKDAFIKMIKEDLHQPYTWTIRHFKEKEINEVYMAFTNLGKPYGFKEILSDNIPGPDLEKEKAREIAEKEITQNWNIDLNIFKLVESSKEIKPSKRSDHTFIYERTDKHLGCQDQICKSKNKNNKTEKNTDIKEENGHYRLRVVVSGDKITEINHFIKIPENFINKYKEMRAYNNSIANTASFIIMLIYLLFGCLIGTYFLFKKNYLIWKAPLILAFTIAIFYLLERINVLPSVWMNYNTINSANNFLINYIISALFGFVYKFFILALTFIAAEGLTRLAFANHIQLWEFFKSENTNTKQVAGRTISGYFLAAIFLAFDAGVYLFATKYLCWWTPADSLSDPNVIANYAPWLTSFSTSLHAGFWEESLFRAIPLAIAAIIGQKYGKKNTWIAFAFILQAIVFGAAHANYAQQPAYARLVELIIPSFMFAGVYLKFGLMPSIITHYLYDLILISIPLFIASSKGALLNQIIAVILALLPILIILIARIKAGKWTEIKEKYLNKNWISPERSIKKIMPSEIFEQKKINISKKTILILLVLASFCLASYFLLTPFKHDASKINITQEEAKKIAIEHANKLGLDQKNWTAIPILASGFNYSHYLEKPKTKFKKPDSELQHKFIWQHDKNLYKKLLGSYLNEPQWLIRFIRFTGSLQDKAEQYTLFINKNNNIYRIYHKIPEDIPGENLNEENARKIALEHIKNYMKTDPLSLKELAAKSNKYKDRTKWKFTFVDEKALETKIINETINKTNQKINNFKKPEKTDCRIVVHINGNQVSDAYRYVNIPEELIRSEKNKNNTLGIIEQILSILMALALIILVIIAGLKTRLSIKWATIGFISCFFANLILTANSLNTIIANFDPIKPFNLQVLQFIWSFLASVFFSSTIFGLILGLTSNLKCSTSIEKRRNLLTVATLVGIIIAGINAFITYFKPSIIPLWPNFDGLNGYIPGLNSIIKNIITFIRVTGITTIFVYALNYIWKDSWAFKSSKYRIIIPIIFICVLSFSGTVIPDLSCLKFWLLQSTILAIVSIAIYILLVRLDLKMVPIISATIVSFYFIQNEAFNAYPYSILTNTITRTAIWIVALALVKIMDKK